MHNHSLTVVFDDNTQKNIVFATDERLEEVLSMFKEIRGLQRLSDDELTEFLGEKAEIVKPYLHIVDGEYARIVEYSSYSKRGNDIIQYNYKNSFLAGKMYIGHRI
jgi:hypothetical protein